MNIAIIRHEEIIEASYFWPVGSLSIYVGEIKSLYRAHRKIFLTTAEKHLLSRNSINARINTRRVVPGQSVCYEKTDIRHMQTLRHHNESNGYGSGSETFYVKCATALLLASQRRIYNRRRVSRRYRAAIRNHVSFPAKNRLQKEIKRLYRIWRAIIDITCRASRSDKWREMTHCTIGCTNEAAGMMKWASGVK